MKTKAVVWLVLMVCWVGAQPDTAGESRAGGEIRTIRDFRAALAPYGQWVELESYGACWVPVGVSSDWRPYVSGSWVWTDRGWYWSTSEPWGWVTYHYGRWMKHPKHRWVWVPDVVWAPAWVAWREGDGYIGWAPLSPECDFDLDTGRLRTDRMAADVSAFVYVRCQLFTERIHPAILVANSRSLWEHTVDATHIRRQNDVVVNYGPSVQTVEHEAGITVAPVEINIYRSDRVRPPLPPPAPSSPVWVEPEVIPPPVEEPPLPRRRPTPPPEEFQPAVPAPAPEPPSRPPRRRDTPPDDRPQPGPPAGRVQPPERFRAEDRQPPGDAGPGRRSPPGGGGMILTNQPPGGGPRPPR